MIPELGHYALMLALAVAVAQAILPLIGAARGDAALTALGRPAALAQLALVAVAFAALTWSYVVSDFTVLNVVENSHSTKPMLYKVTGVWGNHEGSLLLWLLVLTLFGGAIAAFGRNLPPTLQARVLAVQAMIGAGFAAFILFTSNPFLRVDPPPADGNDLNPLLQDPGLAFHPPFLYLGYVGFSVAFAFAVAALIEGRVDAAWARWVRPWTLAAWCALTLGIALGSWWAYYELGWGGFWFWDPVENASFMPWLAGTALLHSAIVVEKRDSLKSWTILLAILTFSLSLLGTFLVRSGIVTSVHAFAQDPGRGLFILALLMLATGGALLLYALRAPTLKASGQFGAISREGALVFNNLLLTVACATVLLGTLFPIFFSLGGGSISVGAGYFDATFVPLMVPLLVAVAIGPFLPWKRGELGSAMSRLWTAALAALAAGLAVLFLHAQGTVLTALGIAVAVWLVVGALVELGERIGLFRLPLGTSLRRLAGLPRAAIGMTIAHAALGVAVAGIVGTSAWQVERILVMRPGEKVALAGYELTLDGVSSGEGPNYQSMVGQLTARRDGRMVAVLQPERRLYTVQRRQTTEAAIHTTWMADLYAVIGETDGKGGITVRLYWNPLAPWIWIGAALCALGGAVSLTDRRHRVGAPRPARRGVLAPAE